MKKIKEKLIKKGYSYMVWSKGNRKTYESN